MSREYFSLYSPIALAAGQCQPAEWKRLHWQRFWGIQFSSASTRPDCKVRNVRVAFNFAISLKNGTKSWVSTLQKPPSCIKFQEIAKLNAARIFLTLQYWDVCQTVIEAVLEERLIWSFRILVRRDDPNDRIVQAASRAFKWQIWKFLRRKLDVDVSRKKRRQFTESLEQVKSLAQLGWWSRRAN